MTNHSKHNVSYRTDVLPLRVMARRSEAAAVLPIAAEWFVARSVDLSLHAYNALRRIFDCAWVNREWVRLDAATIQRVTGVTRYRWRMHVRSELARFFDYERGHLWNADLQACFDAGGIAVRIPDPIRKRGQVVPLKPDDLPLFQAAKMGPNKGELAPESHPESAPDSRAGSLSNSFSQDPKDEKKEREGGAGGRRRMPLTADFVVPDDWIADARAELDRVKHPPIADLALEAAKFVAHQAGNGTAKADWRAVWLKWCLGHDGRGATAEPAEAGESPERKEARATWNILLYKFFSKDEWPRHEGPRPGEPGCKAPNWLIDDARAKWVR